MSKHTPGPWIYGPLSRAVIAQTREATICVCEIPEPEHGCENVEADTAEEAQASANGRLLAAAPDLLAVCEKVLKLGGTAHRRPEVNADLRAAIAKAKGER
jgi:hypothetical protein